MNEAEQSNPSRESKQQGSVPASKGQRTRIAWIIGLLLLLLAAIAFSATRMGALLTCPAKSAEQEILAAPIPVPSDFSTEKSLLTMLVLDVGQGDAILLLSPSGKTMLVDAGDASAVPATEGALQAYGISQIDAVVATHPHADHIGGMPGVLQKHSVGAFYTTDFLATTAVYDRFLSALAENGCPVYRTDAEMVIPWDDELSITVLNPLPELTYTEANNASIVLRIAYGDVVLLLMGDAEAESEMLLLRTFGADMLRADVLKLGHHGSKSSSCAAFLDAVRPTYAVASMGRWNEYGHPHDAVLNRLQARNISLFRTDTDGVIAVFTDGKTVAIVP